MSRGEFTIRPVEWWLAARDYVGCFLVAIGLYATSKQLRDELEARLSQEVRVPAPPFDPKWSDGVRPGVPGDQA